MGRTRKGVTPATTTEVDKRTQGASDDSDDSDDQTTARVVEAKQHGSVIVEDLRVSEMTSLDSASRFPEAAEKLAAHPALPPSTLEPPRRLADLIEGTLVGEYEIERKIGQGGMGAVYSAVHPIGKRVAIKIIGDDMSRDESAIARFRREARAVAQLASPHIVDVFGFGELGDGRAYFVMEYLTGESLRDRLARGRVPLDEALGLLDQVARGLEVAHEAGIVHRDLKPENIFIERTKNSSPVVKLLDFGIVKITNPDENIASTQAGVLIGTPVYVAPEQIRAAGAVDHRADIYALGGVAFELILGRVPFERATAVELVAAHLECAPPQPRELWPEIPAALDAMLFAMLAKDPAKRPTLGYFQEAIEKVQRSAFATTTPTSFPEPSGIQRVKSSGPPVVIAPLGSVVNTMPVIPLTSIEHASNAARRRRIWIAGVVGVVIVLLIVTIAATRETDDDAASATKTTPEVEVTPIPPRSASVTPIESAPVSVQPNAAIASTAKSDATRPVAAVKPKPDTAVAASKPQSIDGELAITAKPPCDIVIDGKPIGRHTPLTGLKLDAGIHRVQLVNAKFGIDETVGVQILSGKQARIVKDYSARIHAEPNGTINPFGRSQQ